MVKKTGVMTKAQYQAYFDKRVDLLADFHPAFEKALSLHWAGDFLGALKVYESGLRQTKNETPEQFELAFADCELIKVKIGQTPQAEITTEVTDSNAKLVLQYARFYSAFWTNHKVARSALKRMLILSLLSDCRQFFGTTLFLIAHLQNISGRTGLGFWLARIIYRVLHKKISTGNPWPQMAQNSVLASYPYALFVAGKFESEELEDSIYFAEQKLPVSDPFYRSLLLISGLYGFAYSGNIARSEVYGERFQKLHAEGQLKRYEPLSKLIVLLPFALRGHGHLVRDRFLSLLERHDAKKASPLVNSQFYRISAVIYLMLGHNRNALCYIEKATRELTLTNSFRFWIQFDKSIMKLAERNTPFDPREDRLLKVQAHFRTPTLLGPMLFDVIRLLPKSIEQGRPWLIEQIKIQLCEHVGWSKVRSSNDLNQLDGNHPSIVIGDLALEFLEVPFENVHYLNELLTSISPAIHVCLNAYDELEKAQKVKESAALGDLASQVAHNILNPVDVLDALLPVVRTPDPEQKIMIRNLVARIKSVANGLLRKRKCHKQLKINSQEVHLVAGAIDSVITEKRAQFATLSSIDLRWEIKGSSSGLFATFDEVEIEMVLSNIVNNSVEAILAKSQPSGFIEVILKRCADEVMIEIKDNGSGIPKSVLGRVLENQFSYGKPNGNGVGLHHARQHIESWGGVLSISSVLNQGTTVEIRLPQKPAPNWFVETIDIRSGQDVVIVDDEESTHNTWRKRFETFQVRLHHFYSIQDFELWFDSKEESLRNALFLIDFDFSSRETEPLQNGLDLIEAVRIASQSVLVSSLARDEQILLRANTLNLQVLPKNCISQVAIRYMEKEPKVVLIDDDDLIREAWQLAAESSVGLMCFSGSADFLRRQRLVPRHAEIYIDSNLGDGQRGEDVAIVLANLGFKNISITTARPMDGVLMPTCVRGVIGKRPPWAKAVLKSLPAQLLSASNH